MQERTIYPSKDKWSELKLAPEEEKVYELFSSNKLPPEWEMYIHPHLNGLRPDLVLLHPKFGIAVYEFKDWDFHTIQDVIESDLTTYNPLIKIGLYEGELLEFYCPRLGVKYETQSGQRKLSKRSVSEAITVGLIFTKVSQAEIDNLKSSLIGRLETGNIFADVPRVAQGLINRLNKYQQYYPIVGLDNLENLNVFRTYALLIEIAGF